MGSMGLLLADWSVELFRARRKKAKKAKMMEKMERMERVEKVEEMTDVMVEEEVEAAGKVGNTEKIVASREVETSTGVPRNQQDAKNLQGNGGFLCLGCEKGGKSVEEARAAQEETAKREERLGQLVGVEPGDVVAAVEDLVAEAAQLRTELEQLRAEGRTMAERVGRQLGDRDNAHAEKVRSLESLMAEKEKQLLQSSNLLRQQLAHGKKEREALQRQLDEKISSSSSSSHSSTNWEAECNSLKLVLEIRRDEAEQLKAANNSLRLELERFQGLETQLQVQKQRAEELGLVVAMKNDQLRQVLDEYDSVQQQLEVEVSAHLACQQELERSQWVADSILSPAQQSPAREKTWKNLSNQVESGLILDVVQKGEKGLAYSFNC